MRAIAEPAASSTFRVPYLDLITFVSGSTALKPLGLL